MTKSNLPWSLKGVSLEARARAKMAAGEAGEPLGKWLGDTIRRIAEAEATKIAPQAVEAAIAPEPPMTADPDTVVPEAFPAEPPMSAALAEVHASASAEDETSPAGDGLSIPRAPIPNTLPPASTIGDPARDAAPSPPIPAVDRTDAEPSASRAPDDWRTAFVDLTRRLDESERRLTASVAPLQVAVERILSRLDRDQPRPRRGWRIPRLGRPRDDR